MTSQRRTFTVLCIYYFSSVLWNVAACKRIRTWHTWQDMRFQPEELWQILSSGLSWSSSDPALPLLFHLRQRLLTLGAARPGISRRFASVSSASLFYASSARQFSCAPSAAPLPHFPRAASLRLDHRRDKDRCESDGICCLYRKRIAEEMRKIKRVILRVSCHNLNSTNLE